MKPLCPVCGDRHESWQGHRFASNAASNSASNARVNASNGVVREVRGRDEGARGDVAVVVPEALAGVGGDAEADGSGVSEGRKQRWSRESYNAYQREYMKVYRAVRAGKADWVK